MSLSYNKYGIREIVLHLKFSSLKVRPYMLLPPVPCNRDKYQTGSESFKISSLGSTLREIECQ